MTFGCYNIGQVSVNCWLNKDIVGRGMMEMDLKMFYEEHVSASFTDQNMPEKTVIKVIEECSKEHYVY